MPIVRSFHILSMEPSLAMKRPHIVLTLLAVLMIATVPWAAFLWQGGGESWGLLLGPSLLLSQAGFLSAWATLMGKWTPWRVVAVALILSVAVRLLSPGDLDGDQAEVLMGYAVYGLILMILFSGTAIPLLGLRVAGFRLLVAGPGRATGARYRWQFSILSVLQWTAAVALLFGMVPWLLRDAVDQFGVIGWVELLGMAVIANAILWATLGRRWWALRWGLLLAINVLSIVFFGTDVSLSTVLEILSLQACTLACFLALRWAGYRLIRGDVASLEPETVPCTPEPISAAPILPHSIAAPSAVTTCGS